MKYVIVVLTRNKKVNMKFEVITTKGISKCKQCKTPIEKGIKCLSFSHGFGKNGVSGRICKKCIREISKELK